MLTKDVAICIRAVDYSETSQIVTFFARATGKISTIAKGSKRPKSAFDGPIEIFSQGKIVFSDSNREKLATLTEFEQQPILSGLRNNLFALNCCFFGAELLNNMTDDYDPHPELFDGFMQFLQNSCEAKNKSEMLALLILFQLSLLKEVGLMPVLDTCVNCKTRYERFILRSSPRPSFARRSGLRKGGQVGAATENGRATSDGFYFSSTANGLICKDCEANFQDKMSLTKDAAVCLANLKLLAGAQEKTLNEVERILIYHFTELLGHRPKLAKHILKS
jgi:DNA repair protein RecO (recombination protein O)